MHLSRIIGKSIVPILLLDVLGIPGLEDNFLSVRKCTENGKRVTFLGKQVQFSFSGEVFARGKLLNSEYCPDLLLKPNRSDVVHEQLVIDKNVKIPPEAFTSERLADVYELEHHPTLEKLADVCEIENTFERLADVPADPDRTVVNSVVVDDHGESNNESSEEFPDDDDDDQDSVTPEPNLDEIILELKRRDDWDSWKVAIDEEMTALKENKTWEPVSLPPGHRKPILNKWVFTVKDDGRYKARLVAKGCSQRPGLDNWETYTPVVPDGERS
ncbi:uncharacterized protein LOC129741505 [Uranotaenia lowii]|uniref:uncharacterized protein LOC129741505 n=1 Tax=Uranotaenia lowii TaxID=190385 RepID=UPI0024787CB1|nr:uncharacterized protein LOC129741505 [Uranotaenia lowii]